MRPSSMMEEGRMAERRYWSRAALNTGQARTTDLDLRPFKDCFARTTRANLRPIPSAGKGLLSCCAPCSTHRSPFFQEPSRDVAGACARVGQGAGYIECTRIRGGAEGEW